MRFWEEGGKYPPSPNIADVCEDLLKSGNRSILISNAYGVLTVSNIKCLKCGSSNIDNGRTPILAILGLSLIAAGFLAVYLSSCGQVITEWLTFDPCADQNPGATFSIMLGVFMLFSGITRSERVRCRKCGNVFTPPHPRLSHAHTRLIGRGH